ncbi:carboxypeptidase regulatory-like domain-containing protein [Candidatus Uhrbacteria bacterium]|nr:carboxypeptidase regulatory-like domain-containing protein [Candidatus Uhrbacteria bacterium]
MSNAHRSVDSRPWRGAFSFLAVGMIAGIAVMFQTPIRANPATTTGPDYSDLVLSYDFETSSGSPLDDRSRYGHNGTSSGAMTTPGKYGSGYSFDGADDYIRVPHSAALSPTSAITVEAWVSLDAGTSSSKILQKRGVFSDTSGGYMIGAWFGNPRGYGFEVYDSANGQHLVNTTPERLPTIGAWTHVTSTFDGSAIKLYENGQLVGTTAWSGMIQPSTKDLYIGIQPDNNLMPFKGKMDEVRIYNRALSAEEVSCSYEGKVWWNGSCQASANRPPVVVSMDGVATATSGVAATWTTRVHDPDGGALTYQVDWGDGSAPAPFTSSSSVVTNDTQSLPHTYQTAGTFTPRVTVTDSTGLSTSLSASLVAVAAPADTQAPSIPLLPAVSSITATGGTFQWQAPSDNVGVTRYEIRYRANAGFVSEADWTVATPVTTPPIPPVAAPGTMQEFLFSGLTSDTPYAVAIKACDAAGNCSPVAVASFRTSASVGEGGLLGHWKFDGNGNNEIAGGPSAATVGNAAFRSSSGKIGGYAYVPTQSDSVKIPYQSTFDLPNTFTVALWFRQRADRSFFQDLVYKGTPINNYNFRIFRQLWNQYNFGPIITGYTAQRTGFWSQTSNPNQLAHNEWHHVVYTKSETGSAYYLDGSLTHALDTTQYTEYAGPAKVPANDIIIGDSAVDTDFDDLRIYNRALSASEARELGGFPAPDTSAPNPPTALVTVTIDRNVAGIRWDVPSDNVGVTRYVVRRKTGASLTESDWAGATAVSDFASTGAVGEARTMTVTGLSEDTAYVVGVKACDAAGNCSTIASVAFRTLAGTTSTTTGTGSGGLPTGNAGVRVIVRGPNSQPVSGAAVTLSNQGSSGSSSGTTNVDGMFTFSGLASGPYNLSVYPPSSRNDVGNIPLVVVTLSGGTTIEYVASLPSRTTTGTTGTTTTTTTTTGTGTTTGTTGTTGTTTTTTTGTTGTTTGSTGTTGTTTTTGTTGTTTTGTSTSTSTSTTTGTSTSTSTGGGGGGGTTTTTTGTATLRVIVRDAAGAMVSGAFVGISFPGGGVASPTMTTGADGIAVFSNIAAGTYHLGISPSATRADLGSVTNYPVALAIGSTTEVSTTLPVRTVTTGTTTGTIATAAQLCGTVSDPDRNILSGITIGLSQSGGGSASLGMSVVTGADGRYCFMNLAPGTYVIGAMTPAARMDLSPPGTAIVSLAAGTTGSQDLIFGRAASVVVTPGIAPPPPSPVAAPLPAIERCVRDAFGLDLYERMRTGRYKPKQEEYERAKHCFNLTVIVDHRPVETPIGAPAVPSPVPSIIVLPGPAVPPPSVRPPEFDDRCEARELPRVKRGMQQLTREFDRIDRELARLRTAKVAVPIDTGLLLVRARDLLKQVQAATTCEDAFTAGEELPDLMQQLRTSIERVSRLRFAPRVLTSYDREVKRFLDRTRTGIRRLERAKFAIAEFQSRLAEAEGQLKECRASGAAAIAAIDPELFEDTMRSCFEILDEAREIQSLVDALANARAFLTGTIEATLRKANRVIRDLERTKKDATEVKQFRDALRQQRDEALAAVRRAGLAKEELVDLVEETITAFGDLDDAFERALGTSTYEEIVGKAPPPTIATPKLEKSAEEFFERE